MKNVQSINNRYSSSNKQLHHWVQCSPVHMYVHAGGLQKIWLLLSLFWMRYKNKRYNTSTPKNNFYYGVLDLTAARANLATFCNNKFRAP